MKKVFDFPDFKNAVESNGKVIVLENTIENFYKWQDDSSLYKIKKHQLKVLLREIVQVTANL